MEDDDDKEGSWENLVFKHQRLRELVLTELQRTYHFGLAEYELRRLVLIMLYVEHVSVVDSKI